MEKLITTRIEWTSRLEVDMDPLYKRKTSIVATIGPKTNSVDMINSLREAGINIVRLNFSHGSYEYHQSVIENVRESQKTFLPERPVAIALDTKGPEIRTGRMKDDCDIPINEGHIMTFTTDESLADNGTAEKLYVDYPNIVNVTKPGKLVYMDDGILSFEILEVSGNNLKVKSLNSGKLSSKKGINLPMTEVDLPALSPKDVKDLEFGVNHNVDIIFASFIRSAEDVNCVRKVLGEEGENIKVISKVENYQGVNNFDEILEASDGIMVARGDLGIEIPCERVFIAQKMMIAKCNLVGKPVICATQMLESMTYNPRPTRAEVSDVANAVLDGADCVMLSGETAKGDYPVKAVKMMDLVCVFAESSLCYPAFFDEIRALTKKPTNTTETIASSAVNASIEQNVAAIIVLTTTGYSIRMVSKYRPRVPIISVTRYPTTARQVHLHRGCFSTLYPFEPKPQWQDDVDARILWGIEIGIERKLVRKGDWVVVIQGWRGGPGHSNNMRVVQA